MYISTGKTLSVYISLPSSFYYTMKTNFTFSISNAINLVPTTAKENTYVRNFACFWITIGIYLFVAGLAIVGNGLVLRTTLGKLNFSPLRHLDCVIKSLAWTDMLHGLIGIPCGCLSLYYAGN